LYLQVAIGGAVIMREKHQSMISDYTSIIRVARKHHLASNSLLGGSDRYLLTLFIHHKPARIMARKTMRPEHQGDSLSFQPLLSQAFSQVIGKLANGSAGFIGI